MATNRTNTKLDYDPHCFNAEIHLLTEQDGKPLEVSGWLNDIDSEEALREQLCQWQSEGAMVLQLEIEGQPVPLVNGLWE
jgi:hypothetical protein